MKKIAFLFTLLLIPSCILHTEEYDDYCYEYDGEYPMDCWYNQYREECCEWATSRRCFETWCSDINYQGYSECRWHFEERTCY